MSMNRLLACLAATFVALAAASASAQGLPTAPGSDRFWEFQPFIDPGYFEHDFQFFAPPEIDDFGGEEKPNDGFYITWDRTYVNVTRPVNQFSFGSGNQGDFTWGNRMELGYMHGDPKGWQGVLWHVNGPNETFASNEFLQEVQDIGGNQTFQVLSPAAVQSLNQLKMSSFELNRVWRVKPTHNGGYIEPFLGYRYVNLRDYYRRETTQEVFGFPPNAAVTDEFFRNFLHTAQFENQMHGGQLGARLFRQRGHWMLSCDVKFFTLANFQTLKIVNQASVLPNPQYILIDGDAVFLTNPLGVGADVNRTLQYHRAAQFCFGGEIRGEAAYELTRDISLRVGFVFLDFGQGIGRGDLLRLNNQGVIMAGATFGFTVNR
jgi:hypothetical protein